MSKILDNAYEAEVQNEKINKLAQKIWDSINEVDYDPMNPNFEFLDDPVKDKIVEFATEAVLGFPSIED